MQSLLIIAMFILLLLAMAYFVYVIVFKGAKDFKEDIEFKPKHKVRGDHVHNRID